GEPISAAGRTVQAGVSMGVATADRPGMGVSELMRNADIAMYQTKARGKGGYQMFRMEMADAMLDRARVRDELEAGVGRGEIHAYYQPIVDLRTGAMIAVEALARWHHPVRGLLMPSDMIKLAEETGLIVPLGKAVLDRALHDLAHPHARIGDVAV